MNRKQATLTIQALTRGLSLSPSCERYWIGTAHVFATEDLWSVYSVDIATEADWAVTHSLVDCQWRLLRRPVIELVETQSSSLARDEIASHVSDIKCSLAAAEKLRVRPSNGWTDDVPPWLYIQTPGKVAQFTPGSRLEMLRGLDDACGTLVCRIGDHLAPHNPNPEMDSDTSLDWK